MGAPKKPIQERKHSYSLSLKSKHIEYLSKNEEFDVQLKAKIEKLIDNEMNKPKR